LWRAIHLLTLTCVLAVALASDGVIAQIAAPPPPVPSRYPVPTYEEDWRRLAEPDQSDDAWDPLKFIPLTQDRASFLSFGGEARATYERFGNQNFGLSEPSPHGYMLQRYLLHGDVHVRRRVRAWTELNSSFESGRVGGPRPVIDRNGFDVHQGFVETTVASRALLVRVGRQEIAIGSGRLYALREGANVPLSFDGVRAIVRQSTWRMDLWAARPVINRTGLFDDRSSRQFQVWGTYASRPPSEAHPVGIDAYYLGLDRGNARFDQGIAHETRHTVGGRIWRQGPWGYDCEAMFQVGRFGGGDIRAWRGVGNLSRIWSDAKWRPRVDAIVDVASGDTNPRDRDLQTFNAFFQSGTYSGRAQLLGPNNSIRLEPTITMTPRPSIVATAGWAFYWRQSVHDGLYGIPGNLVVPSNDAPGRFEGSRPTLQIDWSLSRHLSSHINYIYVFNGEFEQASVHGTPAMSFISTWLTYRF
jgi:hypothetical protein